MLIQKPTYGQTHQEFKWEIPKNYNIGVDVCDKWADGSGRLALIQEKSPTDISRYTFDQLKQYSNQFARVLQKAGVGKGDRVAAHEYPRQIHFVRELPMTTTGKIIRRELRQQYF